MRFAHKKLANTGKATKKCKERLQRGGEGEGEDKDDDDDKDEDKDEDEKR